MRFERDAMSAADFSRALRNLKMDRDTFCRLFGQDQRKVRRWLSGEMRIPDWVPPVMQMLLLPGAIRICRDVAAIMIRKDDLAPEAGPYPFKDGRHLPEDAPSDAPLSPSDAPSRQGSV